MKSKLDYNSIKEPDHKFRRIIWKFSRNFYFESFIMMCIIFNIVTLAMSYETAPTLYNTILTDINLFFTVVFIFEAFLKLLAYGAKGYFLDGWN